MAIPQRLALPATYFVTAITWNRRRCFQVTATVDLFLNTLQHCRHKGFYHLHAYVVMPGYVHLLVTPQAITLERAMMLMEGGFFHRLASTSPSGNEA